MSTSITISITQSCTWGSCTKQNIDYHVLLIHVSKTYNTIMSLHALGISVDVNIRQLSVKKSC